MNFCDKSDLYISLYIDEQLELKEKEEFEKHLEKCTHCAQKLKEESYFVQLCKEDEEIILPKDFSASLHSRLMEISREENNKTNETTNKKKLFFMNRKLMAFISTAAVIVLSLLAYGLIPELGSGMKKASSLNESASMQAAVPENAGAGTGSSKSAAADNYSDENVNSTFSDSSEENTADNTADITAGVSDGGGQKTADSKKNSIAGITEFKVEKGSEQAAGSRKFKVKASLEQPAEDSIKYGAATNSDDASNGSENANAMADEQRILGFAMPVENTSDLQYFTNYIEMTLAIESGDAEMESLNKLMTEYGASEQSSGMVQGFLANLKDSAAYVEYSISLSDYATLQNQAQLKYKLELKAKTDIIKKDITEEYNSLENKKNELENKINEALDKGEDITALETEKSSLIEQINSLIARQEMITIRIFFVKK